MTTNNIIQLFATNVRLKRIEQNISQEKLAGKCGLHRTYISDIERCRRNVSLDAIQKIAEALSVKPYELLKEEEENNAE